MAIHYSSEKNVQMLIALMKANGVKKVIASPGTTNINFIGSIQQDPWFEIYSAADERSAAYIACGLAAETREAVAISCTGATASRNYLPGLTEAYYRKLPILAITSAQHPGRIGSNTQQVIDRTVPLKDVVVYDMEAGLPATPEDEWALNVSLNKAFIALKKNGGGPVHVNLVTSGINIFDVKELPNVRVIRHIGYSDKLPKLKKGRVAIYVGNHEKFDYKLSKAVDEFCQMYDCVVICDHTSNYQGLYKVEPSLLCNQRQYSSPCLKATVMIYIGYVNADLTYLLPCEVWRVNPDGEIRDCSRKTSYVFQMEELDFFNRYVQLGKLKGVEEYSAEELFEILVENENSEMKEYEPNSKEDMILVENNNFDKDIIATGNYFKQWQNDCAKIKMKVPELPFSNAWIAQNTAPKLPENSVIHFGIVNTLRTWSFFNMPASVCGYSNTGGFGIDGDISSLLGASLGEPDKLFFGIVGDLAFFYDMNVLGNRHFGRNVRLILVNNGRGTEFRLSINAGYRFGDEADQFVAAAGHYGNKSRELIKHYATDLGFEYLSASTKEEYLTHLKRFTSETMTDRPMLFEVFTDSVNETQALDILLNLEVNKKTIAKKIIKSMIGEKNVGTIKRVIKEIINK